MENSGSVSKTICHKKLYLNLSKFTMFCNPQIELINKHSPASCIKTEVAL